VSGSASIEPPLVLGEAVEAREHGRLHGVRKRVDRAAALHERADELARVERVALRARDDPRDDLRLPRFEQVLDELLDGAVGQRLERQREVIPLPAAPALPPVKELGPGERDHEHRRVPARLHDELDEVEEAVARPVQVLEHDHERRRARGDLDRRPPGGEERGPVDDVLLARADGGREERGDRGRLGHVVRGEPRRDRVAHRGGRRILADADEPVEHRAERPVREPLAVWKALRDRDARIGRAGLEVVEEFFEEP